MNFNSQFDTIILDHDNDVSSVKITKALKSESAANKTGFTCCADIDNISFIKPETVVSKRIKLFNLFS